MGLFCGQDWSFLSPGAVIFVSAGVCVCVCVFWWHAISAGWCHEDRVLCHCIGVCFVV